MTKHLPEAIVYHLDEPRDELRNAQLTDTARIAATARVQVEALKMLIDPTPEQSQALEAVAAAFEDIHATAKRVGFLPEHSRIRKAFDHAFDRIDAAQSVLLIAKPSEDATKRGL
jgi:predicted NAD/FAD-binding protein